MTSIAGLAPSPSRASTSSRKAGIDLQLHKHVLHVWSVDGRGESFCAECSIECRWACPPGEVDAALADGLDQLDADWEPEWTPQIGFWGTVEVFHERRLFWAEEDETTGSVWLRGRVRLAVKVIERFDLRSFPFDVQDMNLLLVVYNAATLRPLDGTAELQQGASALSLAGCDLPDFELLQALPMVHRIVPAAETSNYNGCALHSVLFYERQSNYYFWNVLFPLFAISLIEVATWSLHWRDVEGRLSIDVTLLLVTVAFKQVLSAMEPPVSYLTLLDYYSLACVCLLMLATLSHAAVGFLLDDCDLVTGDCQFRFLLGKNLSLRPTDRQGQLSGGEWAAGALALDIGLLGLYGLVLVGYNCGFALNALRHRRAIDHRLQAHRLPHALRGYTLSEMVVAEPTGRAELDLRGVLLSSHHLLEAEPLGVLPSGAPAEEETPRERDGRTAKVQPTSF